MSIWISLVRKKLWKIYSTFLLLRLSDDYVCDENITVLA